MNSTSDAAPATTKARSKGRLAVLLDALASYGLAILLLFCLFVLTLFGTLYQVDHGLYEAVKRYFESWFLWTEVGGISLPIFPGGITCMGLLAINMLLGGLIRIKVSWRNIGVVIIHIGIAFMLLAALVKMNHSREGHLTLFEGERSNVYSSYHYWEVAIWEVPEPGTFGPVTEHLIQHELLADLTDGRHRTFTSPELPFELVLSGFLPNCDALRKGPMWEASGPVVDGFGLRALPRDKTSEFNVAGIHAEVRGDGEPQRGILWGRQELPWDVRVDGRNYAIDLRHTRYEIPFTVQLDDFQKEDHPGISMAKAYRSWVTTIQDGVEERILIEMNEPLRSEGLVFFQTNWGPQSPGPHPRMYSVLTVVHNPSDKWPEYSMWVITVGMLIAFGRKLFLYLRAQTRKRAADAAA